MNFWNELKRRNVFRVAAAYLVIAWLIVQVADVMADGFGFPEWFMPMLFVLLGLGLPVALVFSWAFEITPEGVKRERDVNRDASITPHTGKRLDLVTIGAVVLAVLVLGVDRFWLANKTSPDTSNPTAQTVSVEDTEDSDPETVESKSDSTENAIAVLPFADMSPEGDQEYFSDGLSEEILNLLAQIKELKVIGRTSSFAFKGRNVDLREIGDQLGASYLLEGSVRKAGDQLRITAQLIEAEEGTHLWSETYDRRLENIFQIQDEIAGSIVDTLAVSLAGDERPDSAESGTDSMAAYDRFLEARRLISERTPDGMQLAARLLDEALELDPDFAQALAARAQVMLQLSDAMYAHGDRPLTEVVPRADELLDRALGVNAQLASAHAVRGLRHLFTRDFDRASLALDRALEINPSHVDALNWRTNALLAAGRIDEWIALSERALEVDPLSLVLRVNLSLGYQLAGRIEKALATARRVQNEFPDSFLGYMRESHALMNSGQLFEAVSPSKRARSLAPGSEFVQGVGGDLLFKLGRYEDALEWTESTELGSLTALGREDEAVVTARANVGQAPGAPGRVASLLFALLAAERYDEILSYYDERFGTPAALESFFASEFVAGEVIPVAVAMSAENRHEELEEMLTSWRSRLDRLRELGYANANLSSIEAIHASLNGEPDAAIEKLASAIDLGYRDPLLERDPAFSNLADLPAFQAQVERMTQLINTERAKLGLEPLQ